MKAENQIVGGTVLRIPAIQSPDFVSGVSGWMVSIDGSAEFNNLTIRGEFQGTQFIINSDGAFFYSGTPANGNLLVSIAGMAGTDAFGNSYPAGVKDFGLMSIESGDAHGGMIVIMHVATTLNPGTFTVFETAAGNGSWASAVSGDAHARHVVRASGQHEWGDGTNAADTIMQRLAAGLLALSTGNLLIGNTALGDDGVRELAIQNVSTEPTVNPTGGGVQYAKSGVPKWRTPGGQLLGMIHSSDADATADLLNFTAETDITGATLSVKVDGAGATVIVHGHFDMQMNTSAGTLVGFLNWNGADRTEQAVFTVPTAGTRMCISRTWEISGVAAGTYTAKLRASCTSAGANNGVRTTHTGLVVIVREG